jgi:AraC family transcriptional regulator, regulatory protein of adaptative response / methylated-DNA-[protein]-cysteine methyltransferase
MTTFPDMPVSAPTAPTVSPDRAWQAVVERDRAFDGLFVLAVHTTHIYCRPSCPARRPRRENTAFYQDAMSARADGFRACMRCAPDEAGMPGAEKARAARALLDTQIAAGRDGAVPLVEIATAVGLSTSHLQRCFRDEFGMTPSSYVRAQRAASFRAALRAGATVNLAAFDAGYSTPSRAYVDVERQTGMSPARYGRGGAGMRIGWGTRLTSLGTLLIGATPKGLCWVSVGDDPGQLLQELHQEYPSADIREGEAAVISVYLDAVEARMRGERGVAAVSVDMPVTAFHWRVLQALTTIPPGETRSYSQVAAQLGSPRAARAVANACATNTVAIVIPCHRVIHSDGSMSGYRWGNAVKKALLLAEGAAEPRGVGADPAAVRRRRE